MTSTHPSTPGSASPSARGPVAAPRLVVAAAIVDDFVAPTRLLAARRTEPPALAGGWEFAGGKVDPGESPIEAVHREVREELGVAIELGPHVPGPLPGETWALGDRYEMLVWFARVTDGVPAPIEDHDELRWLTAEEFGDVPWLPADLPIVERIRAVFRGTPKP